MTEFIKDVLARNFQAGAWVEGDSGAVVAVEGPGKAEHVADCARASGIVQTACRSGVCE